MVGRIAAALLFALCCALDGAAAEDGVHVVASRHYRLHHAGTQAEAEEAARVLEAAWGGFAEFFRGEPALKKGERLTIRFYATAEAWAAGIRRDGTRAPRGAGGYYWPGTRTAHLYRQPTTYFTRTLLIHEAAHQFHFLTRTRNRSPTAGWYTEGVAEHLSWHRWDGTRLELGVIPGVTLKDYPAKALAEVVDPAFDLGAIVDGGAKASRPVAWALFRFLATGRDGEPLPRFGAFQKKMDHGGRAAPLFRSYFGRPDRLQPKLRAWLEKHQTAWSPVFNEWEQTGPARFRGYARVVTACRLKAPAGRLRARLALPPHGPWRGGLLLHWASNADYTVALLSHRGRLQVNRRLDGRWQRLGGGRWERPADASAILLEARREDGQVHLRIGGREVGAWSLPGGILGLAQEGGDVHFADVAWR